VSCRRRYAGKVRIAELAVIIVLASFVL